MKDPRDKYVDEPIGASLRGDITATWWMLSALANAFSDDPRCGVRCKHGGTCSEPEGHDGAHNTNGYCQWEDDDE